MSVIIIGQRRCSVCKHAIADADKDYLFFHRACLNTILTAAKMGVNIRRLRVPVGVAHVAAGHAGKVLLLLSTEN